MILLVAVSMMSPVEEYARRPSALKASHRGCAFSSTAVRCTGGYTVASNTTSLLRTPSAIHSSRSSGVNAMPWLGHSNSAAASLSIPSTATRSRIKPVCRSPTSKPTRPSTFANASVPFAFVVNGQSDAVNGPTVLTMA